MVRKVKDPQSPRRRGTTTISTKHQITIPVSAMEEAGLHAGDRLRVRTEGSKVVLEPERPAIEALFGAGTGLYDDFDLDELRNEWQ